ncbi:flavin reductase family protein [Ideonella sp.]|jgi:flavin reductase (DIM6/NTAB) family NADH-FMN oxidoreductase RutF|uniref:flavin reductase family protein n=1 Tax=Ideonella sp. TaxID=1929293 RepID=UPI0037C01AB8
MRVPVELSKAYRLLNHGPTVLISAEYGIQRNAMACAWAMPLDFEPPKVAVVIDRNTFTRGLVESSGRLAISVPCVAQARLVTLLGTHSGHEQDKLAAYGVQVLDEPLAQSPLIAGCVAWLDCVLIRRPEIEQAHDLFLAEVTHAWARTRVFSNGRWHFDTANDSLRTLHHVAGGHYFATGQEVDGHH